MTLAGFTGFDALGAAITGAELTAQFADGSGWGKTTGTITASGKHGQGIGTLSSISADLTLGIYLSLGASGQDDVVTTGFFLNPVNLSSLRTFCGFLGDTAATSHISIAVDTNGTVSAYRGLLAGTLLGTSSVANPILVAGTFSFVEIQVKLHDTTGYVVVKLDGITILNLTNVDTKNAGTATVFDYVAFGGTNFVFDDIYITNEQGINTTYLGADLTPTGYTGQYGVVAEASPPNGNGNSSQGVGSDGNSTDNYLLVDEVGRDEADYVVYANDDDKDTYAFTNLTASSGSIAGVQLLGRFTWVDTAKQVAFIQRLAGTEVDSATMALNNAYDNRAVIFETDPAAAEWTVANFNSAEFGVKRKA